MNTQNQNGYMLLFRGNDWYKSLSPEETQKVTDQWMAWFRRLNVRLRANSSAKPSSLRSEQSPDRHAKIDKRRRRICPVCLANVGFIAASATSASGLTGLAVGNFFLNATEIIKQTKLEKYKMKTETLERKTDKR